MKIKFLTEPALLIGRTLVVADLHIGIEYEIYQSGITIPSQVERMENRIDFLIRSNRANHLIILGDVKHQVPRISWQEYREIPEFLGHFKVKVSIVKGNHDGNIESLAPRRIDIYEPQGFVLGDVLLTHGQAWPDKAELGAKNIVMGHVHPIVEFWTMGIRMTEPCWLRCGVDNRKLGKKFKIETGFEQGIIMPSFNRIIGGVAFNSRDFRPIGPLLTNNVLKWKDAEVHLLDGTHLGSLRDIKRR